MSDRIAHLSPNLTPITCMVWNIQGTKSKTKINALKEVVKTYKPSILALVETHMDDNHAKKIRSVIGYNGHSRVDTVGFSGGIWLYWRPEIVNVVPVKSHDQFITVEVSRQGELPWFFSTIYASPNPQNRHELWSELETYAKSNNHPWMLAGDFNESRSLTERHGRDHNMARRCALFNDWIEDCELIELEISGPSHTWARGNSCETRQSARLDRALCNSVWGTRFENASVKHLPAYQSDHSPLLISPNGFAPLQSVRKPFRFQAAWLTHEKFTEFVDESWTVGSSLVDQLSSLSHKLQNWNQEVFGNIFRKKRELLARIEGCQKHLSIKRENNLIKLEAKLRRELDEVLEREELLWYQKS
ncbi:uncharacterized protein LOC141587559 [Silene latifolia]|uniref:uncharacterized protein LOC141587559 n=1 Tax=Silene latifolia TaxID=37657 RepID=UPI003D771004